MGNSLIQIFHQKKLLLNYQHDRRLGGIGGIGGDGANLIFTDVMLKITGEDIDSITYTLSKGKFVEDVTLTAKELQTENG